jgi:gliding motility-associated-like protein
VDGGAAQTATGSTSPILLGTAAGVYDILDIEDANCVNTASGTGTIVINNCDFTIPTAITPNADGVHDDWELYGLDAAYPNNVVRIFNRWGGLLYEHDSSVDGPYDSNRWKGDYNGEALPVGSYYYIIELNDEDKKVESGAVSILLEK